MSTKDPERFQGELSILRRTHHILHGHRSPPFPSSNDPQMNRWSIQETDQALSQAILYGLDCPMVTG